VIWELETGKPCLGKKVDKLLRLLVPGKKTKKILQLK